MRQPIRILLADDHAILRGGLRLMLAAEADMQIVGECGDFGEAISLAKSLRPDVICLDLTMPGGTGLAAIPKLTAECASTRVVVLTMHDEPAYVRSALAAGASGFVAKSAADIELIDAIRAVHQGRSFVDRHSAASLEPAAVTGKNVPKVSPLTSLSEREYEVMLHVAEGHTNQAVAEKLSLSVKTVESYRSRVMQKLGLTNRAELTRLAIDAGLLRKPESDR